MSRLRSASSIAIILDAWSRKVVGYAISRSIDARLAIAALNTAIARRRPPRGCIHHSDRGSQYAAEPYRKILAHHGLVGSMGRRGNPFALVTIGVILLASLGTLRSVEIQPGQEMTTDTTGDAPAGNPPLARSAVLPLDVVRDYFPAVT